MIKIYNCFSPKCKKRIKVGEILLCHYPNGELGWAARNLRGEYRIFEFGNNNGWPPKRVTRFAQSNTLY